jgi:hypothetical protein
MTTSAETAVHVLGIRHHGPGSARNLIRYLDTFRPDILLIEGPSDASNLLEELNPSDFEPPIAILQYDRQAADKAVFFPFTMFSPEWQAIDWAKRNGKNVQFIDLPIGMQLSIEDQTGIRIPTDQTKWFYDPLGSLSREMGYEDVETWWESYFETLESEDIFKGIHELITHMRSPYNNDHPSERINLYREAFMREQIRVHTKKYKAIAVICGAWHTPALAQWDKVSSKDDKNWLDSLSKRKMESLWIPWSYNRISKSSGYGAGVKAPVWYELLMLHGNEAVHHWMAHLSRSLRKEGFEMPPTLSIDASQLSYVLASLRMQSKPGYREIQDASIAVFGYQNEQIMNLIQDQIPIGDRIGKVPEYSKKLPIQIDFELQCKRLRLATDLKHTDIIARDLDLRKENHVLISAFLHQLNLIQIPWGKLVKTSNSWGTFKESWTLQWDPQYYFNLVEASTWGVTIRDAVIKKTIDRLNRLDLPELVELLHQVLDAGLEDLIDPLINHIGDQSHINQDVFMLIKTFNKVSRLKIDGHARNYNLKALEQLIHDIYIYTNTMLTRQVKYMDPNSSLSLFKDIVQMDQFVNTLDPNRADPLWKKTILEIASEIRDVNAISGACFRLTLDKGLWKGEEVATHLLSIFSGGDQLQCVSFWLNGFLQDNFLILLYDEVLFSTLQNWIENLSEEAFIANLPLLRSAFESCDQPLKVKIFQKVGGKEHDLFTSQPDLPEAWEDWLSRL